MLSQSARYAKALVNAWERTSGRAQEAVTDRFVKKIREDHIESLAPEILSAVKRELEERTAERTAKVTVAHSQAVGVHTFDAYGRSVIEEKSDLVGGFRVQQSGVIFDASLAAGLSQIRSALAGNE